MHWLQRWKRFGQTASHDRLAYREYQTQIGLYYLQYFVKPYTNGKKVLDIGCAEGGLLTAFEREGYQCTGLECSPNRIQYAQELSSSNIRFICGAIESFSSDDKFDIILMLDVIEHLEKKLQALENVRRLLAQDGMVIISFPPFRSPFGGHQQVMKSILKFLPYFHLLPEKIFRWLLERIERENVVSYLRNYRTGSTMRQFEQLVDQAGFKTIKKVSYLVRPRQALRFGLKVRRNRLKIFQEYLSTGVIYVLGDW